MAWKKVLPRDQEAQMKQVNGKMFNWCIHHKACFINKPSECHLGISTANMHTTSNKSMNAADNTAMTLTTTLAALHMDEA